MIEHKCHLSGQYICIKRISLSDWNALNLCVWFLFSTQNNEGWALWEIGSPQRLILSSHQTWSQLLRLSTETGLRAIHHDVVKIWFSVQCLQYFISPYTLYLVSHLSIAIIINIVSKLSDFLSTANLEYLYKWFPQNNQRTPGGQIQCSHLSPSLQPFLITLHGTGFTCLFFTPKTVSPEYSV